MSCIPCGLFPVARFLDCAVDTPFGYITFSAVVPGRSNNLDYHVPGIHKFAKKLEASSMLYVLKG